MYPSYVKSFWSISLTVRDSFPIRSPSVPDEGSAMLTNKQHELLCFIHRKLEETGVSPSIEEMKEALDLKSKSGINRLHNALEERKFILSLPNRDRAESEESCTGN